ncbi:MAG: hypothetical protein ABEI27_05785 [Halobellus sp.]|uniref:hypothetical protein n=1 Tax=Halobellus sp. TaxID=1979212 RepID=UPI0035D473CB
MNETSSHEAVIVRRPMNDHGTMTVEVPESNEIRHICEYGTPELRRTLGSLPADANLSIEMVRVGVRANVWRAVDTADRQSARPTPSDSDAMLRQES